ncbi:two-component regulator propeller domain-containing protein [Chitinophaga sp. MM2321]|uniref:ligand-binding sensor domain-containing protein n=1 Tax=Chitinophaga sp. MM2321 TaxID=3137178 RepID=UPI0032D57BB5
MTKLYLDNPFYSLLLVLMFFTCCNGPNKTQPQEIASEQKTFPDRHPKLIKTQGSHQSANVRCGLQDKAGNLWFGTIGEGVYRYDGKLFTQFTVKDGLNSNLVWSILEDTTGNIWFGTSDGICRYDGKKMTEIPISVTNGSNLFSNTLQNHNPQERNEVFSIIQDKSGIIWFGTTAGVYCCNGKSFTRFLDGDSIINKNGLSLKSVQCMLQDKNGNVWFGSGPMAFEGICLYDGKSLTNFKPKDEGWIRNILEDKKGNIWFGTRHYGACRYDGTTFTYLTEKEGIGNPMLVDKAGNIWFGGGEKLHTIESNGGIWCYDGKSYKNFNTKDGLGNYSVWSIMEDKAGNIWVGTRNNGLYRYDGKTFTSFSE